MRHLLLLFSAALAAATPVSAGGQYLFFDTNGDQVCDGQDILLGTDVDVDVYLDTEHDGAGGPVSCVGGEPLSMLSYEIVFEGHPYRGNTYSFGAWTNAVAGFAEVGGLRTGDQLWVAYSGAIRPPGRYRLGTLTVSVEGCAWIDIVPEMGSTGRLTAFGSECPGSNLDNTIRFGSDFASYCGAWGGICDGVRTGTWGMIKRRYR